MRSVARPGIVEIEPDAAVVRTFLRDLDRIAEFGLEQRIRIGADPDRQAAAPAVLAIGQVALHREKDPAIARQDIDHLQATAVFALVPGNAEDLVVEALLEDELALLGGVIETRCKSQSATAEVPLHRLVERGVKGDGLAQGRPIWLGGNDERQYEERQDHDETKPAGHDFNLLFLASNGCGIKHHDTRPKRRHPKEVRDIEREQVGYRMDMADGDKSGVMDLLADDPQRTCKGFPRRVNVRRLHQERECRLK